MNSTASVSCLLAVALFLGSGGAQSADLRSSVWDKNKLAVVRVKVSGRNAQGEAVPVRYSVGVVVRAAGVIVTAAQAIGQDSEWNKTPDGLDRQIEVSGLDANQIARPLGSASARLLPSLDIAILTITAKDLPVANVATNAPDELATLVTIAWDPKSNIAEAVSTDSVPTDKSRDGDSITVRFPVMDGYIGAGVFDGDTNLVGVIYRQKDGSRLLAVPSYLFKQFLPPDRIDSTRADDALLTALTNVKFSTPNPQAGNPQAILESFNLNVTNEGNQAAYLDQTLHCLGTDLSAEPTSEPLIILFKSNGQMRVSSKDTSSFVYEYDSTSPISFPDIDFTKRFWTAGRSVVPQFSCIYTYTYGGSQPKLGATAPALFLRHVVPQVSANKRQ